MTTDADELDERAEQARRSRDRTRDWPEPTDEERRGFEAEHRDDEERERRRRAGDFEQKSEPRQKGPDGP